MTIFSKIILCGDGAVGKTALRSRFMGESFKGEYLMTIGADMSSKQVIITANGENLEIKFQIWDLAGQARFQDVRVQFYQGASGAILVFDVTRPESFENTPKWMMEIKKAIPDKIIPVVILGNKIDLRSQVPNPIQPRLGRSLALAISEFYANHQYQVPYYETSAKTGENVEQSFLKLAEMIIVKKK